MFIEISWLLPHPIASWQIYGSMECNKYVCIYVQVCIYVGRYVCIYMCTYVCTYVCMYAHQWVKWKGMTDSVQSILFPTGSEMTCPSLHPLHWTCYCKFGDRIHAIHKILGHIKQYYGPLKFGVEFPSTFKRQAVYTSSVSVVGNMAIHP
jgi:hypothetical protein